MTRTLGAKAKAKTVSQLVKMLQDAAEKEGVQLSEVLVNQATDAAQAAADAGGDADAVAQAAKDKISKFSNLELELEDDEIDTYKCGSCGETMASEMNVCPNCETVLNWG